MYLCRKTSVDTACTVIYRPATITEDSNVAIKTENGEICEHDVDTADSNNEKDTPRGGRGKTNSMKVSNPKMVAKKSDFVVKVSRTYSHLYFNALTLTNILVLVTKDALLLLPEAMYSPIFLCS